MTSGIACRGGVAVDVLAAGDGRVEEHRWVDMDEPVGGPQELGPDLVDATPDGAVFGADERVLVAGVVRCEDVQDPHDVRVVGAVASSRLARSCWRMSW